jgi:hypothetical protein
VREAHRAGIRWELHPPGRRSLRCPPIHEGHVVNLAKGAFLMYSDGFRESVAQGMVTYVPLLP